ncbi:MAG: BON domain-containing protein [Methylobacter sp.]|uniref:BON domain-containing protein n=1 Tax=Methylobacter sp. TaxID=2051955 RepID=UPI002584A714|nr:BON domain-containing protein [Methylobacter sp.]MCL7420007.1 BON domain-containing protein [Methylobacter sp.]
MKSFKHCSAFFLALVLTSIAGYGTAIAGERLVIAAGGGEYTAGEYVDDAMITTKVKAAIVNDARLSAFDINVETNQGVVQLNGFVDSQADINEAAEVAQRVEGVKSVENNLQLKSVQ